MKQLHKLRKKLKSFTGETLAETLVAVLIISLASVTLATMIGAASRMNQRARKYDDELDKAIIAMTSESDCESKNNLEISVDGNPVAYKECITVIKYKEDGQDDMVMLSSYKYEADTEG